MKPICPAFRTILCALAIAAATTVASATTITYFGFNTVASGDDSYQLGNTPWQLTLNLNDPLVDLSGGGFSNYTPSAVTMTIDGAIRPSAPALTPLSFLLVVNGPSQSGYGNVFYNFWVDSNSTSVGSVQIWLASPDDVTDSNGMLLPSISMDMFTSNGIIYSDPAGDMYGVVTGYSVETSNAVPDASPTVALFGLGLAAIAFLRRRVSR